MQHESVKASSKCFQMLTTYIFTLFYKTGSAWKVQHSRDKVQRPAEEANHNNSLYAAFSVSCFPGYFGTQKQNAMRCCHHINEVATLLW